MLDITSTGTEQWRANQVETQLNFEEVDQLENTRCKNADADGWAKLWKKDFPVVIRMVGPDKWTVVDWESVVWFQAGIHMQRVIVYSGRNDRVSSINGRLITVVKLTFRTIRAIEIREWMPVGSKNRS